MVEIPTRKAGTSVDGACAMRLLVVMAIAILGGCGGTAPPASQPPYEQTLPSGPCAVEGITGAVPGVTLAIRSDDCVYEVGRPARFSYEIAIDAAVPPIDIPAASGCGSCTTHTTDPRSWIRWRIDGTSIEGDDQTYCLCDVGCCPAEPAATIQPEVGVVSDVIEWSGRTWQGPSDTGQPEGAFFALGLYQVRVTFFGFARGSVTAELPIEVIPAR